MSVNETDLADLDSRQDQISEILSGLPMDHALTVMAWVIAGAIHQANPGPKSPQRAVDMGSMVAQFSHRVLLAVCEIEEGNEPPMSADKPEGVTVQ